MANEEQKAMSNEKLGAEQGRVTPKGAENVCPVCYHDFADCPCPFEVKPAEQAYHARGAGREALVKEFESFTPWIIQHADICPGEDLCECGKRERVQKWREALQKLREPAERGTTPPEGLAFTFEEFIDMSLRHNKRLAAGISGIASFGHWYNEMLAATQRAPVEQGREKRLPDGAEAMMLDVAEDISQQFCGGSEAVTEIIAAKLTEIIYNSKPTAAPDHAREGALRDLVAKWRGLRGVDWSAEPDGWKVTFNVCADELERALADGKEGGE